ncbi:MAG: hypothetical protein NT169_22700 [Chloroflexi bacterium]|nr:hypothetical protein [Chloroflexota bacterium]
MPIEARQEATLLLYQIEAPDWANVQEGHQRRIAQTILSGGWRPVNGRRRGFLNCHERSGVVYGYFAREGSLQVEQYDDQQQPLQDEQPSFERILFILFLNEGMLLVQSIRVYNYQDLSGPLVREALFDELEIVLKTSGLSFPRIKLERYKREYTREQMVEIFLQHDITRVEIDQLMGTHVPVEVRLFNPDFDADLFTKSVIDEALTRSDQIDWVGEHLQTIKMLKGIVTAGSPKIVVGTDDDGELREWLRSAPEEITLALDTNSVHFPEDDLERLLSLVKRKLGLLRDRLAELKRTRDSSTRDLPLFNGQS